MGSIDSTSSPTLAPQSRNQQNKAIVNSKIKKIQADRMIDWLVQTPVRNVDASKKSYGSFSHGVHDETGHSQGQYTEITGYGVSILSHLYRWHASQKYLKAAKEAAQFLLGIQHESGAYPHCPDPERGCSSGELFTFDTSMCTMGIMDLYAVEQDQAYLDSAQRAGQWLIAMQREDGAFKAKYMPDSGHTNTGNFFGDGSCIHVKNAMALFKLAEPTGDESFDRAGRMVCDYVLKLQAPNGLFWAMPSKNFVFTHAHCYACEGFYSAYAYTGEQRYLDAALKGIDWLKKVQNPDGSVFQVYEDSRGIKHRVRGAVDAFKAADATSQAARLFALAGDGYEASYDRAIEFIKSEMQSDQGGLFYTKGRFRTNKMLYAWPTMFAIQAIEFAHREISPRDLF